MTTKIRSTEEAQNIINDIWQIANQFKPERSHEARRLARLLDDTMEVITFLEAKLARRADAIDLPEGRLLYKAEIIAGRLASAIRYHADSTPELIRHSAAKAGRAKKTYGRIIGLRASA